MLESELYVCVFFSGLTSLLSAGLDILMDIGAQVVTIKVKAL